MDRIFITGATGYVGNALARFLADRGNTIHALVRSDNHQDILRHPGIKIFKGDLHDKSAIQRAIASCNLVYHVAAYVSVWHPRPEIYAQINVIGTRNILDAAIEAGVRKVVFTSTAGVFGPSNGEGAIIEGGNNHSPPITPYAKSKLKAEEVALAYCQQGLDVTIVNPTRVYGPGINRSTNAITSLIGRCSRGKVTALPGKGQSIANWVYIDDVVRGHILAMEKGRSGERYILGGSNVSTRQFFQTIRKVTGTYNPQIPVPVLLLLWYSKLNVIWAKITGRPPLLAPQFVKKLLCDWETDSSKARTELNYRFTPLHEGIAQTVDWLDQNGRS